MNKTKNSLSEDVRSKVASLLNQSLADLTDLYLQSKQAHWNVRGRLFYPMHKLFDDLAESVEGHLDEVAERVTALGGTARGTVRQAAAGSRLPEFPDEQRDELTYATVLRDRFAFAANETRRAIDQAAQWGDADTADLLTGISRDLDKGLWQLEAHGVQ